MIAARQVPGYSLDPVAEFRSIDLSALLELPTGDPDGLTGSGSLDAGTSLAMHWALARWSLTIGVGYAHLGDLSIAPDLRISDTWTATGGFEFQATDGVSVLVQMQGSSSPYAALDVDGVSEPAVSAAVGARFALGRHWLLDFALAEDVLKQTSDIDVGLILSLEWRP